MLKIGIVTLPSCRMRNVFVIVALVLKGGTVGTAVGDGTGVGAGVSVGHLFPDRTAIGEFGDSSLCSQIKLPELIETCIRVPAVFPGASPGKSLGSYCKMKPAVAIWHIPTRPAGQVVSVTFTYVLA